MTPVPLRLAAVREVRHCPRCESRSTYAASLRQWHSELSARLRDVGSFISGISLTCFAASYAVAWALEVSQLVSATRGPPAC